MTNLRLYGKTPRCWWCGKKIQGQPRQIKIEMFGKEYETIVCSEKHEHAVADAYAYIKKVFVLFPIGLIAGALLFMANTWFHIGYGTGLLLFGLMLIICPVRHAANASAHRLAEMSDARTNCRSLLFPLGVRGDVWLRNGIKGVPKTLQE